MKKNLLPFLAVFSLSLSLFGCHQTYSEDRIKESIEKICRQEYGVENVRVKIEGGTVGVYLPLKKLFDSDFKEALLNKNAKAAEMDHLFQPSPEALDQVEDVLFSTSRVLLSTDRAINFYVLQATDIESTGLQLVLTGFVDDIKRVRLWDISRDEYRKRILHELKLNRAVLWHRPVVSFFQELEKSPSLKTVEAYFAAPLSSETFQSLFFFDPEKAGNVSAQWRLGELRSTPLEATQVLVYAPVQVEYDSEVVPPGTFRVPPGSLLKYFFLVSFASEPAKIVRVIPLSYLDETGKAKKLPIPEALDLEKDLTSWETEFPLHEIHVGDFLAEQLTRRTQSMLSTNERIQNTFEAIQLAFHYNREEAKSYFSLELDLRLRTPAPLVAPGPSASHEDVLYLLDLISREFVDLLRSYRFSDYEFLELNLASDPASHILGREKLELFRRNKTDLQGALGGLAPL